MHEPPAIEPLFTAEEVVAAIDPNGSLGLTPRSVRTARFNNQLVGTKIVGRWAYLLSDVKDWQQRSRRLQRPPSPQTLSPSTRLPRLTREQEAEASVARLRKYLEERKAARRAESAARREANRKEREAIREAERKARRGKRKRP